MSAILLRLPLVCGSFEDGRTFFLEEEAFGCFRSPPLVFLEATRDFRGALVVTGVLGLGVGMRFGLS